MSPGPGALTSPAPFFASPVQDFQPILLDLLGNFSVVPVLHLLGSTTRNVKEQQGIITLTLLLF